MEQSTRATTPAPSPEAFCSALAARHYENFPVRDPLLRSSERRDLAAVYAFCRTTDDLGDEAEGDRDALLSAWREQVAAALSGRPPSDPVLVAVSRTAGERNLDPDYFFRVIEANVRDQVVREYADRDALLDYCAHSATPVGRMVLGIVGAGGEELAGLADRTCIGLQLANFWQDLARDRDRGRCYLPLSDCRRHGVDPTLDLAHSRAGEALRSLLADEISWARECLREGWPLADRLPLRWRALVRGFTRGGWAVCDAIEALDFDTLARRPTIPRARRARLLLHEWSRAWRTGLSLPDRSRP